MSLTPLECSKGQQGLFDIVAIPAIGADPYKTWLLSPTGEDHIWSGVSEARIFLFEFDMSKATKDYGITEYARQLLSTINNFEPLSNRPIHFAAYSTGGLALKRALTAALGRYDCERFGWIAKKCYSVAFFGTPHYGSTALSDGACKDSIKRILGLPYPYNIKLRGQLRKPEKLDHALRFSRKFALLTLDIDKIWSFYEANESTILAKMKSHDSSKITETELRMPIVDKRSATIANEEYYVGCEDVIQIKATHATLPRFGNAEDTEAVNSMNSYNETLSQVMRNAIFESGSYQKLIEMVQVECHQFYEVERYDGQVIKLMSALPQPTIKQILDRGPAFYVQQRRQEFGTDIENVSGASTLLTDASPPESPLRRSDLSVEDFGQTLEGVYDIPGLDQYKFRWTHIPVNIMRWVEKVLRRIEMEIEDSHLEAAKETSSRDSSVINFDWSPVHSDKSSIVDEVLNHPLASPAAALLAKGAEELSAKHGTPAKEILDKALQDTSQLRKVIVEAQPDGRARGDLSELGSLVDDTREQITMLKATKLLPEDATPKTVWTYLNKAALKPTKLPSLTSTLLRPENWNFKQYKAIHEHPHGRYLQTSFELFYPNSADTLPKDSGVQRSPNGVLQLFLYFPYVHWDTFGAVNIRNKLLHSSQLLDRDPGMKSDIFKGDSVEKKLIWQYVKSTSDLPLHPRRTLDQYGIPDLEDTSVRDSDQVVYRWRRNRELKKWRDEARRKDTSVGSQSSQLEPLDPTEEEAEKLEKIQDDFKVLMVDRLWCWVLNDDNVITFFPGRDNAMVPSPNSTEMKQSNAHRENGALDLRDAIYNDVNGDNIFQLLRSTTQCYDCLDFVANVVWHAVTLFLPKDGPDKPIPTGLRVFHIFCDSLYSLGEMRTKAFGRFKQTQKQISDCLHEKSAAKSMKLLTEALDQLGNCDDLTCLINARDILEELGILDDLFGDQDQIIQKMAKLYSDIDTANKAKAHNSEETYTHDRAITLLKDAGGRIQRYRKDITDMNKTCKNICQSYQELLGMKQKEINIVEATYARVAGDSSTRQQYAMMTFTVVTVLFLPLSFFTSLFGMNVKEWSGEHGKSLHAVMVLSGTISAGVIVLALVAAFWTFDAFRWKEKIRNGLSSPFSQGRTRAGYGLDADSTQSSDLEQNLAFGPVVSGSASPPPATRNWLLRN